MDTARFEVVLGRNSPCGRERDPENKVPGHSILSPHPFTADKTADRDRSGERCESDRSFASASTSTTRADGGKDKDVENAEKLHDLYGFIETSLEL